MLVVFPSIFVAGTKMIYGYNFVGPLSFIYSYDHCYKAVFVIQLAQTHHNMDSNIPQVLICWLKQRMSIFLAVLLILHKLKPYTV